MREQASSSAKAFDVNLFLSKAGVGKAVVPYLKGAGIFAQGDSCNSVYYIQAGSIQLTVLSDVGREATIALLNPGDFAGEECLSTIQPYRSATATALTECILLSITKPTMNRVLQEHPEMSARFVAHLLARTNRIQADLVDHLFNSTEKRLARMLLLLANFGREDIPETLVPQVTQETLAAMVGCTRSRANFFLNRFRKLGFIEYDDRIRVKRSLLQVVLHD